MPRSHINRAPCDFPYPAACRRFRDRTGTVRFSFLRHVRSHILRRPGGARRKLGEMQGARKGAGRVTAECRPVTLRAPSDEQVHRWLPEGALPGPGRVPCTELQSESEKMSHFLEFLLFEV